jgi:small subunit ribosomal protein S7
MSRKGVKKKQRGLNVDSKYGNFYISKLINKIMLDGKKSVAEAVVYQSLDLLAAKTESDVVECFEKSLKNVIPVMEVRSKRIGGSTYQVPIEVRKERSVTLAIRWIVDYSRKRGGKSMSDKLFRELHEAYQGAGTSVKKRDDVHKMAEANRAFAHFR